MNTSQLSDSEIETLVDYLVRTSDSAEVREALDSGDYQCALELAREAEKANG